MNFISRPIAVLALLAGALAGPHDAGAQRRPEPQLLLSLFAGVAAGGDLWNVPNQPLVLIDDPGSVDTLALTRQLTPGLSLGASATYFPTPTIGFSAELVFLGYGRDDTCAYRFRDSSLARKGYEEAVCGDVTRLDGTASTFGLYLGGLFRVAPRGAVKPYLRGQIGVTTRSASTVEVTGRYFDGTANRNLLIIRDDDPGGFNASAGVGAGFMIPIGAGYQARLEFRDNLVLIERVTGPADFLAVAPTDTKLIHSLSLFIMLDIVLEQRRGRRY